MQKDGDLTYFRIIIEDAKVKWGCEKCGGRIELSTRTGRTAAKYGMCPKCMSKELVDNYRNLKFGLDKIKGFIPFLIVYPCYLHYNKKKGT